MKLFEELSFLFNWFTRDDLVYFYEQLDDRITKIVKSETVDNDKLQGFMWKMMLVTIERALPISRRYTRITTSEREHFMEVIAGKMKALNLQLNDPGLKREDKESILFSLHCLKFLLALSKQDQLFK